MHKILIPTDFSDNAQKATRYAMTLFGADSNYTLLNTFEVPHSGATMLISIADILEKDSLQLLSEEKARLEEMFPDLEGKISIKTMMGTPSVAVGKHAELGSYDLVIMGTKGATGVKEVLVGSVASKTLTNVKCPVIAVPINTTFKRPEKILFAADDECLMEGKIPDDLAKLANRFNAEVMVLNVVPKGDISHVGNNPDHQHETMGVFENVNHSIHFIEDKEVNSGIESFMEDNKVDLLAMITRRDDLFSRLFGLSNTKTMIMHTQVPLIAFH